MNYDLNEAFLESLERIRPDAVRLLREKKVTHAQLALATPPGRRSCLTFPTLQVRESADFDRQIDTDVACVVLDQHPDELIELDKALAVVGAGPLPSDPPAGLKVYVDSGWLRANGFPVPPDELLTTAVVLEKKDFVLRLTLYGGLTVVMDFDKISCGDGVVWVGREGVTEPLASEDEQ